MSIKEKELLAFWRAARRARLSVRDSRPHTTALDDIAIIFKYTENALVRSRCAEILMIAEIGAASA